MLEDCTFSPGNIQFYLEKFMEVLEKGLAKSEYFTSHHKLLRNPPSLNFGKDNG